MKQNTSPITKNFVTVPLLTMESLSPSVNLMTRPNIMYIVAANRAGAIRMKELWTTYGMRRYWPGGDLADIARQAYPTISTS